METLQSINQKRSTIAELYIAYIQSVNNYLFRPTFGNHSLLMMACNNLRLSITDHMLAVTDYQEPVELDKE